MKPKRILAMFLTAVLTALSLTLAVSAEQTNMEVTVPRFSTQPVFDGKISEAEWGQKTLRMVTAGAATANSTGIGYNANYGLRNTFYHSYVGKACDTLAYDLWIRWDSKYLYVAAIVDDPDPFSLPYGGDEIWNGDMMQIRVDAAGPSAIMLKSDPGFNYKTDAFNGTRFKKPWSSDTEVFNGMLGLVQGKTPTIWRFGKIYGEGWDLSYNGARVGISCVQNADNTCKITYECAIPWSSVDPSLVPQAGDVYGMCVAVACAKSNELSGWLQWGHGNMSVDSNVQPRGTRGGSQAIVLSNRSAISTSGWVKESGYWVYYYNGTKLTNQWKKDSVGWCYLDSNGRMKTNAWVKDSKGWCYVGADGYCVKNCWKKDSVGWCYLDSNGRMKTNAWVKDSKGWCYVGADGYAVTNCWKKDSVGWCYLDQDGSMTKNEWVKYGGKWYYLDGNGYMVTGTKNINGKNYTFNSSGVLVS